MLYMDSLKYFICFFALIQPAYSQGLLDLVRDKRGSVPYQSHYVDSRNLRKVRNGDRMPINAVRPFDKSLKHFDKTEDVVVALWNINDSEAVWGKAWEENGTLKAAFIYNGRIRTNDDPDLSRGYKILTYNGTDEFKFAWVVTRLVDHGTVVYSSANRHVSAVFVDRITGNQYLGDSDWDQRNMQYVEGNDKAPFAVANKYDDNLFDRQVYLLTKQRCSCQC